ncbi:MAG: hypothetical protein IPM64_17295 [Phycisphaerales bacterium]|nr:hypothetical protein [Phycisphaerales bacterium]
MQPIDRILPALQGVLPTGPGKWSAKCPAHDDGKQSLSVGIGEDGRVLVKCHAECSQLSIAAALGLKWGEFFPDNDRGSAGGGKRSSGRRTGKRRAPGSKIVAVYDYRDATGERLLYQTVRFEPKDFAQRRPMRDAVGNCQLNDRGEPEWEWNLRGIDRVLYQLPRIVAAPGADVLIVEGEKDCDTLIAAGFLATTCPQGAGKWERLADDSALAGRRVTIIPDADEPGRRHADDVARRLRSRCDVRELVLPAVLNGRPIKDIAGWFAAGGTAAELHDLLASAPPAKAAESGEAPRPGALPKIGERDADGRIVLSTKITLPTAKAFIQEFHSHPNGPTLLCQGETFYRWTRNRWELVDDCAVSADLYRWLATARAISDDVLIDFPARRATVLDAMHALGAEAYLGTSSTAPCWLTSPAWPPAAGQDGLSPRDIVPCKTSLLHLPSMTALVPTPRLFSTHALDFDYQPDAPEPLCWLQFLNDVLGDDLQAWDLLQEWFGYCLTGDTSQQKMLMIVGARRGGKGTIARVLTQLIGVANIASPTTTDLASQFGLESLIGKSLAIISDARFKGEGIHAVVERLLCISGEDTITIPRKHKQSVTARLPLRIMMMTNELPELSDASGALASRMAMIRLQRSFAGREDSTLEAKLLAELPGILNWAIGGWHNLRKRGRFEQPVSGENAIAEMEDLSSPVGAFVRDRCAINPDGRAYISDLYAHWRAWCDENGRRWPGTVQHFCRDLVAVVPTVTRRRDYNGGAGRFYQGIEVRHEFVHSTGKFHNEW